MTKGVVNRLAYGELEPIRKADRTPATGLSWSAVATLVDDGTTTAALTLTEIGSTGRYRPSFTPTAVGVWALEYNAPIDGVTAYFGQSVQVVTAAQADPAAALAAGTVTVVSPIDAVTGNVTIEQGDDDTLSWTDANWPDLTGATIGMRIRHEITKQVVTASGTVDVATGSGKRVSVALDHAVTAVLTPGEWAMSVKATIAGEVSTLVLGTFTVVRAS